MVVIQILYRVVHTFMIDLSKSVAHHVHATAVWPVGPRDFRQRYAPKGASHL